MTADGAIKNYEVQEGDGLYITYQDGEETVKKKLGNLKKVQEVHRTLAA